MDVVEVFESGLASIEVATASDLIRATRVGGRWQLEAPMADLAAEGPLRAHMQYVLVGAGSVIFAVAPEVRRLTGLDPTEPEAIETASPCAFSSCRAFSPISRPAASSGR